MEDIENKLGDIARKLENIANNLYKPFDEIREQRRHEESIAVQAQMVKANEQMVESNKEMVKANKKMVNLTILLIFINIVSGIILGYLNYDLQKQTFNIQLSHFAPQGIQPECSEVVNIEAGEQYSFSFVNMGKSAGVITVYYENYSSTIDFNALGYIIKDKFASFTISEGVSAGYVIRAIPTKNVSVFGFTVYAQTKEFCLKKSCNFNVTTTGFARKFSETDWNVC